MLDPVQLPTEYGEAGATLGGHWFQLRCLQVVVGWVYQKWGWATGECHGGMSCVIKVDSDYQKWSPPAMLQQDRGRIFFFLNGAHQCQSLKNVSIDPYWFSIHFKISQWIFLMTGPSILKVAASAMGFRDGAFVCNLFTSRVLVSCGSGSLNESPTGFQIQILWELFPLVYVPRALVPDVGLQSFHP